jgi:hypothetical protein
VVVEVMRVHLAMLVDTMGHDVACRDFRKHVSWYLTGYPVGGERRRAMALASSVGEYEDHLAALKPHLTPDPNSLRAARGHTGGPRPVALPEGWFDRVDDPTPPQGADQLVSGG